MKGLTPRQKDILDFIKLQISVHGYAPSYREIMKQFNFLSLGSVYKHIQTLKQKGALSTEKGCSRSLRPESTVPSHSEGIELPLLGKISGGAPLETYGKIETMTVPSQFVKNAESSYIFCISGDNLNEELFCDGDKIIVDTEIEAVEGNTIVLMLNGNETHVKRYFPQAPYVRLESHNKELTPMTIHADDLLIQGVVTGLIRSFQIV